MKLYAHLNFDIVREIIPEFVDVFPNIPIDQRYAKDFIDQCVECDETVKVGMIYQDGIFVEAPIPEPIDVDGTLIVANAPTISERISALEEAMMLLI